MTGSYCTHRVGTCLKWEIILISTDAREAYVVVEEPCPITGIAGVEGSVSVAVFGIIRDGVTIRVIGQPSGGIYCDEMESDIDSRGDFFDLVGPASVMVERGA